MTHIDDQNGADDLSAYLDDRLSPERRADLDQQLAGNPDLARRLEAYRSHDELLRRAFAPKMLEPVPERLMAALRRGARTRTWGMASAAVAAGLVLFLAGGAGGWWLAQRNIPTAQSQIARWEGAARDGMLAHKLYAAQVNRAVEVADDGKPDSNVARWLSKNLGLRLILPTMEAEGYRRLGVRLLSAGDDVAAMIMYEGPRGDRVSIYMRNGQAGESAIRQAQMGDQEALYWIDDGCAYVVTGLVPHDQLMRMTQQALNQLEKGSAG